jgi:hypothetical protein
MLVLLQAAIVVAMLLGLGWGTRVVFAARDLSRHARDSIAQFTAMHESVMLIVPSMQAELASHDKRLTVLEHPETTEEITL